MRNWLFNLLFGAESRRLSHLQAQLLFIGGEANDQLSDVGPPKEYRTAAWQAVHRLRLELVRLRVPRAARFKLEGAMPPEQIAELLAGTQGMSQIKAVLALITAKVIEKSDRATDAPHGAYATAEGTVPAFGPDERLHFAGGADTAAEILAELQELIQPKEQAKKAEEEGA